MRRNQQPQVKMSGKVVKYLTRDQSLAKLKCQACLGNHGSPLQKNQHKNMTLPLRQGKKSGKVLSRERREKQRRSKTHRPCHLKVRWRLQREGQKVNSKKAKIRDTLQKTRSATQWCATTSNIGRKCAVTTFFHYRLCHNDPLYESISRFGNHGKMTQHQRGEEN